MGYASGHDEGSSAALSAVCLKESIQAGPGAYGYFPLIDRQRGFYMQIVLAEDSRCRSEIPEYLRIITKPVVDALVLHEPISNERLLQSSVVSKQHGLSFLRRSLPRLIRNRTGIDSLRSVKLVLCVCQQNCADGFWRCCLLST